MLPAQQQAQHAQIQDLNVEPQAEVEMEIDLNLPGQLDPLEVIIHLVNPLEANGPLELNEFIKEVEENIPQQILPVPVAAQDIDQVQNNGMPHIEGFPIPPLVDLIGEEIPLDQLAKLEPVAEEDDGFDPDLLVGPGENEFPDIGNGGGIQLQVNPDENNILQLADELHLEEQLGGQENE